MPRTQSELRSLIKQFDELLYKNWDLSSEKHNSIVERTYILEEKVKVANHRFDDLERKENMKFNISEKNKEMVKMCRCQSGKNNGSDRNRHDRKRSGNQCSKLASSICNRIGRRFIITYQCGRIAGMQVIVMGSCFATPFLLFRRNL